MRVGRQLRDLRFDLAAVVVAGQSFLEQDGLGGARGEAIDHPAGTDRHAPDANGYTRVHTVVYSTCVQKDFGYVQIESVPS